MIMDYVYFLNGRQRMKRWRCARGRGDCTGRMQARRRVVFVHLCARVCRLACEMDMNGSCGETPTTLLTFGIQRREEKNGHVGPLTHCCAASVHTLLEACVHTERAPRCLHSFGYFGPRCRGCAHYTDDQNKGHHTVNPSFHRSTKWLCFMRCVCAGTRM